MTRRQQSQVPKRAGPRRPHEGLLRLVVGRGTAPGAPGARGAQRDDEGWTTLGTFVIEFQQRRSDPTQHRTLAHHMESAEDSRWQDIVTGALLSWMLGRLIRDADDER